MPYNPYTQARLSSIFNRRGFGDPFAPKKRFLGERSPENPDQGFIDQNSFPYEPPSRRESPYDAEENDRRDDATRYFDDMERIRKNKGPALGEYQRHIQNMPQQKDYEPSKWRRAGAIAAGGLVGYAAGPREGIAAGREIYDEPYNRATRDWTAKGGGLRESAKLEEDDRQDQMKSLSEARAMGLKYDEFDLKRLEAGVKNRMDERGMSVREKLANLTAARDNATTQRERDKLDEEIRYHSAQISNSEYTAKTGRMNADTGRRSQQQTGEFQRDTTASRNRAIDVSSENSKRTSDRIYDRNAADPVKQQKAQDVALMEMSQNPKWKNFIALPSVENGRKYEVTPSEHPDYKLFLKELKARKEHSLRGFSQFDSGEADEDEVIQVIPRESWWR